ncbi:MAG: SDR family oxidoreductase [Ruminococcus sp.]|nr:SDR family oxidoreductase [Ruminococcus sp.]
MTALVTGASSGMGRDMARYLAELGYDLILTARREDRLLELKDELNNVNVEVIPLDLSKAENCFKLYDMTKDKNVEFLINNAGFGAYGKFVDVPLEKELELIDTNIKALHILTKLYIKDMIKKNKGYILNVGSAAGFLSGPTFSSYYASKNYVVRLTEAVHEEMRRDKINVKVSALCPGPVNTEFNKVANVNFAVGGLSSEYAAKYAIDKTLKGKMIITPGKLMKLAKFGEHFLSEKMLTRMSYNMQMKRKDK